MIIIIITIIITIIIIIIITIVIIVIIIIWPSDDAGCNMQYTHAICNMVNSECQAHGEEKGSPSTHGPGDQVGCFRMI